MYVDLVKKEIGFLEKDENDSFKHISPLCEYCCGQRRDPACETPTFISQTDVTLQNLAFGNRLTLERPKRTDRAFEKLSFSLSSFQRTDNDNSNSIYSPRVVQNPVFL